MAPKSSTALKTGAAKTNVPAKESDRKGKGQDSSRAKKKAASGTTGGKKKVAKKGVLGSVAEEQVAEATPSAAETPKMDPAGGEAAEPSAAAADATEGAAAPAVAEMPAQPEVAQESTVAAVGKEVAAAAWSPRHRAWSRHRRLLR